MPEDQAQVAVAVGLPGDRVVHRPGLGTRMQLVDPVDVGKSARSTDLGTLPQDASDPTVASGRGDHEVGVVVDGATFDADLVVDASGRNARGHRIKGARAQVGGT